MFIKSVHFLSLVLSNFNRKHHTLVWCGKSTFALRSRAPSLYSLNWTEGDGEKVWNKQHTRPHTRTHLHIMDAWNIVWGWLLCIRHLSPSLSYSLTLCVFSRSYITRWLSEFQSYPREMSEKCHSKQFQLSSSPRLLYLTMFTSRSFHFVPHSFIIPFQIERYTLLKKICEMRKPKCYSSNGIAAYFIQSLERVVLGSSGFQSADWTEIKQQRNQEISLTHLTEAISTG